MASNVIPLNLVKLDALFSQFAEDRRNERTIILENIHTETSSSQLFFLLTDGVGVDLNDIVVMSMRNVKINECIVRCAFAEFHDWKQAHAAVQRCRDTLLRFPCSPPHPGQVGRFTDEENHFIDTNYLEETPKEGRFFMDVTVKRQKCFIGTASRTALERKKRICSVCKMPNALRFNFCQRCGGQMDKLPATQGRRHHKKPLYPLTMILARRLGDSGEKNALFRRRRLCFVSGKKSPLSTVTNYDSV